MYIKDVPIVEAQCTISLRGIDYTASGSYFLLGTDHKYHGMVYVKPTANSVKYGQGTVTTWHGKTIAPMTFTTYQGNFCTMRRVSFTWQGVKFVGDYCPDWADLCKVRSTKIVGK